MRATKAKGMVGKALVTHLRRCNLIGAHDGVISTTSRGRSKASEQGGVVCIHFLSTPVAVLPFFGGRTPFHYYSEYVFWRPIRLDVHVRSSTVITKSLFRGFSNLVCARLLPFRADSRTFCGVELKDRIR